MLVYVAGPYAEFTKDYGEREEVHTVDNNIAQAEIVAAELWEMGHAVICPHLNTANFDKNYPNISRETYIKGDLEMLAVCDAIVMLPLWEFSKGADGEHTLARQLGIPIYDYPIFPPLHPTEIASPQQVTAFRQILGKMYRTHLDKNQDYSPCNILGTGELGIVVRLWDKIARLMNLVGFKLVMQLSDFEKPKVPKNESIEDSFMDLSVYGIIGLLVRRGIWGK